LFGEKYDDDVRVLSMGDFSKELCGGTHVRQTGDIGFFKIINETAIASGVRRIEALTGEKAYQYVYQQEQRLDSIADLLKTTSDKANEKLTQLLQQIKLQDKQILALQHKLASGQGSDLSTQAEDINGVKVLVIQIEGVDIKVLRTTLDQLKDKLQHAVIVLATVQDGKVSIIAGVTKSLIGKLKANDLVQQIAPMIDGKGGGRPDMAQAGGSNAEKLAQALESAKLFIKGKL